MKTRVFSYMHEANGLAIEIVPETDTEEELLAAVWKHGTMETGHGKFLVRAFEQRDAAKAAGRSEG